MLNKIIIALDIILIIMSIVMLINRISLPPAAGFFIIFKCFFFYSLETIVDKKSVYLAILWGIVLFTAVITQNLDSWFIIFCALDTTLYNKLMDEISS